ncbi:MAG: protease complex subunit PrcB family protein [Pseudothermotoga sp.]
MRIAVFVSLIVGVFCMAGMIYYTPVEYVLPQQSYQTIGSRSVNFQYIILSKSEQVVMLLKGWVFSPVQITEIKPFEVEIIGEDMHSKIKIPARRSGIYILMDQYLFVLPKQTSKVVVGGYEIQISGISYTTKSSRGEGSPGMEILNDQNQPTTRFRLGEKILIKISAGMKSTGGYELLIDSVELVEQRLRIKAHVVSPSPSTPVTQAFTYPAMIIEIDEPLRPGIYQIVCTLFDVNEIELSGEFEIF